MVFKKQAFTLIEMIFVIIIIGILSIFGTNMYISTYETYLKSSTLNKIQNQTEIALAQIKNRLQYRIKSSAIAFDPSSTALGASFYVPLGQADVNYSVLEWVGYDIDSFLGGDNNVNPDWSGFCDIDASTAAGTFTSPGSRFDRAANSIGRMSNGTVNLAVAGANNPAVIFINDVPSARSFGWENNLTTLSNVHPVASTGLTTFATAGGWPGKTVVEQYKLSWTAYALAPEGRNLFLYYNYRPWDGGIYDVNGSKSLLAENVTAFRFRQDGTALQIQLCVDDNNLTRNLYGEEGFAFCKEITIF